MNICIYRIWCSWIVGAGYCGNSLCKAVVFISEPRAWSTPGTQSLKRMLEINNKAKPMSMLFESLHTHWNPGQFLLPLPFGSVSILQKRYLIVTELKLIPGSKVRCWRKISGKMEHLLPHINEMNPQINNKVWELQKGCSSRDLPQWSIVGCPKWKHTGKGILGKVVQSG